MAKKKVNRREVCKFIVTGDVDFSDFTCTKCGKPIHWRGTNGTHCGIKFGIKRR